MTPEQLNYNASLKMADMMPKYVGGYRIGNSNSYFTISLTKKPIWLHRKMMLWCLGWKWIDMEEA